MSDTYFDLGLAAIAIAVAAFLLERLVHALKRRFLKEFNRYRILEKELLRQKAGLEQILQRKSLSVHLRSFILHLSKAIGNRQTSLRFAAWMDTGERKPEVLPCERGLVLEWKQLRLSDPPTADLVLAYLGRASLLTLLLWNETLRSIDWLAGEMAEDSAEKRLHRAALLDTAAQSQAA